MRDISLEVQTEITSRFIRPLFLVSIQFANETVYVWTGVGDLIWNSSTYKGVGTLGQISPIVETIQTQAQGITLSLSGIPNNLLGDALNQMTSAGKAYVWLGFMDPSGNLINDPIPAFIGLTDQPTIDLSTETTTINISVESRLADLQRARGGRLTDADQRQRHPNDGGLKYVAWLQDQFVNWHG
jgi:hypothetical protein